MAGGLNDAQLDDGSTLLKSSTYTIPGPCGPPGHNRKLRSESWRVGITAISPLVSYRPCVTHSFAPLILPQPLDAFSPRMYSIFCSLTVPVRYLGPSFMTSPTSMILLSFLGPPLPARPGHLHPFVHRLTKEISLSFNPFNEVASTPSLLIPHQLFASGCRQTFHMHRSSHWLRPPIRLFGHSPLPRLAQCSALLDNLIPDVLLVVTYMVYVPSSGPNLCPYHKKSFSGLGVHTA